MRNNQKQIQFNKVKITHKQNKKSGNEQEYRYDLSTVKSFSHRGKHLNIYSVLDPVKPSNENSIIIEKCGIYDLKYFIDVLNIGHIIKFGIYVNDKKLRDSQFTNVSSDFIQTTVGKRLGIEFTTQDKIQLRAINTSTRSIGNLNAYLTITMLSAKKNKIQNDTPFEF